MIESKKKYGVLRRLAGSCAAAALLISAGCGAVEEDEPVVVIEQPGQEQSYEMVTAVLGDIVQTSQVRCTYRQLEDQEISFPVSGRIVEKVYVQEGDAVQKGDLLAELSDGSLDQDIARLEYNIARNQKLLEYADINNELAVSALYVNYLYYSGQSEADRKNLDQNIEARAKQLEYQKEDYEDAIEMDQMELERLRTQKSQSCIYAGMSGVVRKMKENLEGSTSAKDEVVMTIIDNSQCIFVAESPEYAEFFHEGESLPISLIAAQAGTYEVVPWNMQDWGDTQTFMVVDGVDTSALEVGVAGIVEVVVASRTNVLTIPVRAVKKADDKTYVYVLNDDGMREVKWIETGLYGTDTVEVVSGLEEGDEVIVR